MDTGSDQGRVILKDDTDPSDPLSISNIGAQSAQAPSDVLQSSDDSAAVQENMDVIAETEPTPDQGTSLSRADSFEHFTMQLDVGGALAQEG